MLREGWEASSIATTLAVASVTKAMPAAIADTFDMAIEFRCPPKAFLLTVLGLCGGTSGPEQLSSGRPRPECIRSRRSLLLHPSMLPDSCQPESLRSPFQCIRSRCSLLLHPHMPPDSVHFVRPTANSHLVSHLAVQETLHGQDR